MKNEHFEILNEHSLEKTTCVFFSFQLKLLLSRNRIKPKYISHQLVYFLKLPNKEEKVKFQTMLLYVCYDM